MTTIRPRDSTDPIPVGKIFCLGRNYVEHAREMKSDVPTQPIVFLKPSTALVTDGGDIVIPKISREVHHEVELVVAISHEGKYVSESRARDFILGYAVGLDMTMRDVQNAAKKQGLPWMIAKGFDTSAPISEIIPASMVNDPMRLELRCAVNGGVRQHSSVSAMIFSIDRVIAFLSSIFTLERGDLVFMGTPEGAGPVHPGDTIEAELVGYTKIVHRVRFL